MRKYIIIKLKIPGFHKWNNAPEKYAYLRDLHRHNFNWNINLPVTDSNREIEFIELKDMLYTKLFHKYGMIEKNEERLKKNAKRYNLVNHLHFDSMSCEMIAEETMKTLEEMGYEVDFVSVSEDEENGALVIK